jgi:hypothetical protein
MNWSVAGIVAAQAFELAQPFVHPQRELNECVPRDGVLEGPTVEHIVEHRVHELVVDDMAEELVIALKGHNNPIFEELGDAPDPLRQELPDDVGLLELHVGVVHDEGDAPGQPMSQGLLDGLQRTFPNNSGEARQVFAVLGEVDIQMARLDVLPAEAFVLHFVLPELRCRWQHSREGKRHDSV